MSVMITFIFVVAVAAFIPYVAAPGIQNGVKAISAPKSAEAGFDNTLPTALRSPDGAVRKNAGQETGPADAATTQPTQQTTVDRKDGDSQG